MYQRLSCVKKLSWPIERPMHWGDIRGVDFNDNGAMNECNAYN